MLTGYEAGPTMREASWLAVKRLPLFPHFPVSCGACVSMRRHRDEGVAHERPAELDAAGAEPISDISTFP